MNIYEHIPVLTYVCKFLYVYVCEKSFSYKSVWAAWKTIYTEHNNALQLHNCKDKHQ